MGKKSHWNKTIVIGPEYQAGSIEFAAKANELFGQAGEQLKGRMEEDSYKKQCAWISMIFEGSMLRFNTKAMLGTEHTCTVLCAYVMKRLCLKDGKTPIWHSLKVFWRVWKTMRDLSDI